MKNSESYSLPLLMTASISTRGMVGACFTDEEREAMYVETLQYYTSLSWKKKQTIVFVDNSGWNLERIKAKVKCNEKVSVEYISLHPGEFDISKGKGYNELLLINKGIEISDSIRNAGGFVKVTGRYPIYNIRYFVDEISRFIVGGGNLYIDIKDHKLYEWLGLDWCGHSADVRMFGVNLDFYHKNIGSRYQELNDYDGHLLEWLMFDVVKVTESAYKIKQRFKWEPHYGGLEGSNVSAWSFSKNQDSLKGRLKRLIGNGFRLFLPFFKF